MKYFSQRKVHSTHTKRQDTKKCQMKNGIKAGKGRFRRGIREKGSEEGKSGEEELEG